MKAKTVYKNINKVVVLGAGESGVGAALLAKQKGFEVFVSDFSAIKETYKTELEKAAIHFEEKQHTVEEILTADIVIKSPGIPEEVNIIQKLRANNINIVSEIEWAANFIEGKIIAITGSNGKTTTTALTHHILQKAGYDVAMAGNIGKSLARTITERTYEYYVVEVSSFQLDDIEFFKPAISVITNITEDHLDRYNNQFENYIQAKLKIAKNQDTSDYCIYCLDDAVSQNYISSITHTNILPFSLENEVEEGGFINNNQFKIQLKKNFTLCQ